MIERPGASTLHVWVDGRRERADGSTLEVMPNARNRMRVTHPGRCKPVPLDSRPVLKAWRNGKKNLFVLLIEKKKTYVETFSLGHRNLLWCRRSLDSIKQVPNLCLVSPRQGPTLRPPRYNSAGGRLFCACKDITIAKVDAARLRIGGWPGPRVHLNSEGWPVQ